MHLKKGFRRAPTLKDRLFCSYLPITPSDDFDPKWGITDVADAATVKKTISKPTALLMSLAQESIRSDRLLNATFWMI